jgi:hypothetical protein
MVSGPTAWAIIVHSFGESVTLHAEKDEVVVRASAVSGIFSQNINASVSFAMTACCMSFVIAPRRMVRLIQGIVELLSAAGYRITRVFFECQ